LRYVFFIIKITIENAFISLLSNSIKTLVTLKLFIIIQAKAHGILKIKEVKFEYFTSFLFLRTSNIVTKLYLKT